MSKIPFFSVIPVKVGWVLIFSVLYSILKHSMESITINIQINIPNLKGAEICSDKVLISET